MPSLASRACTRPPPWDFKKKVFRASERSELVPGKNLTPTRKFLKGLYQLCVPIVAPNGKNCKRKRRVVPCPARAPRPLPKLASCAGPRPGTPLPRPAGIIRHRAVRGARGTPSFRALRTVLAPSSLRYSASEPDPRRLPIPVGVPRPVPASSGPPALVLPSQSIEHCTHVDVSRARFRPAGEAAPPATWPALARPVRNE